MSNSACPAAPAAFYPEADAREAQILSSFDSGLALPVFFFALKAGAWLVIGLALALIASIQSFNGAFLSDCIWFTQGRVQAGAETALTFGWGGNALLGLAFWLIVRLTRRQLPTPGLLIVGAIAWNLGVAAAVFGTLFLGDQTNFAGFQAPAYAAGILAFSLLVFGAWSLAALRSSASDHSYLSEWFLLVATGVFPVAYSGGLLISIFGRGVASPIASSWTSHNIYALWLAPAALALFFYFLPKLTGRALPNYFLGILGFWTWVVVSPWAGPASLLGGPVPVWITSVAGAALLASVMAYTLLASGLGKTLLCCCGDSEGILSWIRFAAIAFFVHGALSLLPVLSATAETLRFTQFSSGLRFIALFGVFSMAALGAFYYVLPRLVGSCLPSKGMSRLHFISAAFAVLLGAFSLCYSSGFGLGHASLSTTDGKPVHDFAELASMTQLGSTLQAAALLVLLLGAVIFHVQTIALWLRICPLLGTLRSLRNN